MNFLLIGASIARKAFELPFMVASIAVDQDSASDPRRPLMTGLAHVSGLDPRDANSARPVDVVRTAGLGVSDVTELSDELLPASTKSSSPPHNGSG